MPAGLFSRAALSAVACSPEQVEDHSVEVVGLPLSAPRSRARSCRAAATAFWETDVALTPSRPGESRGRTPRATSSSFAGQNAKKTLENVELSDSKKKQFRMRNGKIVFLCPDNIDCCKVECELKAIPDKTDVPSATAGSASMAALGESQKTELDECNEFCKSQFGNCFPGDSTVIVRHRGQVALEALRVGDEVLSVRSSSSSCGWDIFFDEVIAFLHCQPHVEHEFLLLRHELGQIHVSAEHLIFAQSLRAGTASVAAPVLAREVCVGDRVLAPWIDGNLATPRVLEVLTVRKQGLYAPLMESGALLVDGTAVSCYAIPDNLQESIVFKRLTEAASASSLQSLYHALFLPLRLASRTVAKPPQSASAPLVDGALKDKALMQVAQAKGAGPIHPYARALYVVASSLMV